MSYTRYGRNHYRSKDLAHDYAKQPMLSRTHGQAASPPLWAKNLPM